MGSVRSLLLYSKTGFFGFFVILLAFLLSILAYIIIPDPAKNANTQIPELALSPMFTKVECLVITKKQDNAKGLSSWIFGHEEREQYIPLKSHTLEKDVLQYENMRGNHLSLSLANAENEYKIVSKRFFFGTDRYGRDILSRLVLGLRVSLFVGVFAVFISLLIGIIIGLVAGYFGGWIDNILLFLINTLWSIPTILLVFAVVMAFGRGIVIIFLAVGFTLWIEVARLVRGQTLSVKEETFIKAGELLGYSKIRILIKHILPNIINPIVVLAAANFAIAILIEAGLSYLGFGVQPPIPSLGNILNENYGYALSGKLFIAVIPALFIMVLVLSFNFVSYTIRDWSASKNLRVE